MLHHITDEQKPKEEEEKVEGEERDFSNLVIDQVERRNIEKQNEAQPENGFVVPQIVSNNLPTLSRLNNKQWVIGTLGLYPAYYGLIDVNEKIIGNADIGAYPPFLAQILPRFVEK
jgi:hypothetical protein